jgi:hypothetical protein
MAIRHLRQQKNRFLGLRDEDGIGHNENYDCQRKRDCPALAANGAHGVTRPTSQSEQSPIGRAGGPLLGASSIQTVQYRYGFESGNAFLINSTRGSAPSPTITSTTSKRKSISGFSSIRSHASAPREIRFCFARSTASSGRPKSSRVRVFTSTKTSVSLSRHTTSISPPLRPRKLRNRIL